MIEPVDPFQRRVLDLVEAPDGAAALHYHGLEQPDAGLGESIVVGVADAPDRGLDARLGQTLRVADRQVLAAAFDASPARHGVKTPPGKGAG